MTNFNEHFRLAQAMLHGHLYIDPAPAWMEHIHVRGHDFILHPPLSALLSVPFVILGIDNPAWISALLGLVSLFLVWRLTRSLWLTAFFLFGTTFLYEATNGASWDFALVASTPFTLAALCELRGYHKEWDTLDCTCTPPRGWVVGLFAGLAALARYDLMLAWPVYLWMVGRQWDGSFNQYPSKFRPALSFLVALVPAVVVYVWFAYARFGTLTDGSVQEWYWHYDTYRMMRPLGPFSIHYLPLNLFTLLFMGPGYQGGFPWLRPQFMGQALLSLSPAFLTVRISPWLVAAALSSIPALTVYASGFSQLGCRYYVQIFPFLIAAMMPAGADERGLTNTAKALIVASIISSMSCTLIVWKYGLA